METVVGVFCKRPVPGKVKTRLAAAIGEVPAARLYEAFLLEILGRMQLAADRRILCYTPDDAATKSAFSCLCGSAWELRPQAGAALGERLQHFFEGVFREGPSRVIVIGSD